MILNEIETLRDLERTAGVCIVRSGTEAYFPAMGFIERGDATFIGERYLDGRRVVALDIEEGRFRKNGPDDTQHSITIGREFLSAALKEYSNWNYDGKWWREAVQNSVDAGARNIKLDVIRQDDGTYRVSCDDDGSGMDRETLITKFLALGGTTKTAASGAAGGFGIAKSLLILPWISWSMHSRDTLVEGSGLEYRPRTVAERKGTRLEVVMPADKFTDHWQASTFLRKCYLPKVKFLVNGEIIKAGLHGGHSVGDVEGAEVYFIPNKRKTDANECVMFIRSRGLYMFSKYVGDVAGNIVAEITAPSIDVLTSNRDGFRADYGSIGQKIRDALDQLGTKIAKDSISALKSKKGLIRQKFKGAGKFKAHSLAADLLTAVGPKTTTINVAQVAEAMQTLEPRSPGTIVQIPTPALTHVLLDQKFKGPNHIEAVIKQLVWQPDFYLVNEIEGYKVPAKFFPETMTPVVVKLARVWVELVRYVFMQLNSDVAFGVGFCFSDSMAACALTEKNEDTGERERWVMLNPHKDMDNHTTLWKPNDTADLKWLYASAIHEATHIIDGISAHDESFSSAMTRNMALCADGFLKIKKIVASIKNTSGAPDVDE